MGSPFFDLSKDQLFLPQVDVGEDKFYQARLSQLSMDNSDLVFRLQSASVVDIQYDMSSTFSAESGRLNMPEVQVVNQYQNLGKFNVDLKLIENSNPFEFYLENAHKLE